jgi:hypothetical protein
LDAKVSLKKVKKKDLDKRVTGLTLPFDNHKDKRGASFLSINQLKDLHN